MKFSQVYFAYEDQMVLSDFSYEFPKKGVVCLFGPSGCGKTTLLRLICGLEKPTKGTIEGLPANPSVVFQEDCLLPWKTAKENISLVGKDADEWLKKVGLGDCANQYPEELSGGMKRRVAIARALSTTFDMLLLDEPFTGIEEERIEEIASIILSIAEQKLVILITHKLEEIQLLDATIISMENGKMKIDR